jgi:tryptophan-rich sensory protein
MVAPRWLDNRVQPIAVRDVVHYLVAAAELPGTNRTYDIGGPDVLTYGEMMRRYSELAGLGRRLIATVPVLTPRLAGLWVGLVTPVPAGLARPLVDSLVHDAVCRESDIDAAASPPAGGFMSFDDAIHQALGDIDPTRWRRAIRRTASLVCTAALVGSVLTDPRSRWYAELEKPRWQPPRAVFPVVWSALYSGIAVSTAAAGVELDEEGHEREARDVAWALSANLALNAAWSGIFFRARRPWLATAHAALLAASSTDLARRVAPAGRGKAAVLGGYAAWCGFATALTAAIARRNRR